MEDDNVIIKDGEETGSSTCVWQPCSPMKLNKWGVSDYVCVCIHMHVYKYRCF